MKPNFDIHKVLARIEEAVQQFRPAAMFELREKGYGSLFEQLISCIISIRTKDEASVPISERLFAEARTPEAMAALSEDRIAELINGSSYAGQKAANIRRIARQVTGEFGGQIPEDFESLTDFHGVGPKCANLARGVALGIPSISVDIHVHRITNRWGYVYTKQPEKTMKALQEKLPQEYWIDINRLLVPFGKHICRGRRPKCPECPVREMCEQNGVKAVER